VTDDGVRVAYTRYGVGGPGYIVIHGWCCEQSLVESVARHLAPRARAVTLDLRGHGASGRPRNALDLHGFVEDVRAVAADAGMRRAVLVGHSMGGRVALAVADALPRLVKALVLLDAAVFEEPRYVAERWRQLSGPGFKAALRSRVAALCSSPTLPSTAVRVSKVMAATPRRTALESLRVADSIDAPNALRRFAGPVLYVAASSPRESMEVLRRMRPDLLYAQAAGAGHFVHLDAPAQVEGAMDRFRALELERGRGSGR
jgi:pimeloyl-ACP methyl ester carboxylesterase